MGVLYFQAFWRFNLRVQKLLGMANPMKATEWAAGRLGRIKVLGLRAGRAVQWVAAVKAAGRRVAYRAMAWDMIKGVWVGLCSKRARTARAARRRAYRACLECPVFDRVGKVCRPHPLSKLGCGCYMPFKVAADGKCWGRENLPDFRWGFGPNAN